MSNRASQVLRRQLFADTSAGEQARDMQGALDQIPLTVLRTITATYSEPLTLGATQTRPKAIELINVISQESPEIPIACGQACHFVWKPQTGGCQVTSIDGMSPVLNGGKKYQFTFRLSYIVKGGV